MDYLQLEAFDEFQGNYIQLEAVDQSQGNEPQNFPDDDEKITDEMDDFIDDSEQPMEDVSFYGKLDPEYLDDYIKYPKVAKYMRC